MLMDAFIAGDVFINYPFEQVKFRWDKEHEKVFQRFYGEKEKEIDPRAELYNEAIRTGKQITKEQYFNDSPQDLE